MNSASIVLGSTVVLRVVGTGQRSARRSAVSRLRRTLISMEFSMAFLHLQAFG